MNKITHIIPNICTSERVVDPGGLRGLLFGGGGNMVDRAIVKCHTCNNSTVTRVKLDVCFYVCPNCGWWTELKLADCCDNPSLVQIKKQTSNGGYQLRKQCLNCGFTTKNSDSAKGVDLSTVKAFNSELYDLRETEINQYRKKIKEFQLTKSDVRHKAWSNSHSTHLQTFEWSELRQLVLKRDEYTCQCCLKNKATEVHHRSYRHIGKEPAYELISLCRDCHQKHDGTIYMGGSI